jgi:superfamily II DNA or RNA helicase
MIQLREYQEKSIQAIRQSFAQKHQNLIFCLPTGGGKTLTFSEIARRTLEKDALARVLILTDRIELLTQAGGALHRSGMEVGLIMAGRSSYIPRNRVIVGMVETFYRRLQKGWQIPHLKLIILDEAHKGNFKKIIKHFEGSEVKIIGATATPLSQSTKDPLKNYFSDIVVGTDIPELIELGYLAKPKYYAVKLNITAHTGSDGDYKLNELYDDFNKVKVYEGVLENYQAHALGKKTLVFCVNIEHAQKTTQVFMDAGHSARCLTSLDDATTRKEILKWFAQTPEAILINCGVLTTGFDEPSIECIILNRATKSLPLYLQMVGRGARVIPGMKDQFAIIDMGNNLYTHGRWEMRRDWEKIFLFPKQAKEKAAEIENIKYCPECNTVLVIQAKECPECGYVFDKVPKESVFGWTEEIAPEDHSYLYDWKPEDMTTEQLIHRAQLGNKYNGKPYKKGWIIHQLKQRADPKKALEEYARLMGYQESWVKYQLQEHSNSSN